MKGKERSVAVPITTLNPSRLSAINGKISSFVFYNVVKVISCQAVLLSNNLALSLSLTEIFSNTTQGLLVPAIVCRSLNEAVMKMQWSFTPSDANLLTIGTTSRARGKSGNM